MGNPWANPSGVTWDVINVKDTDRMNAVRPVESLVWWVVIENKLIFSA